MATGVSFPFGIVEYDVDTWAMVYTNTVAEVAEYATAPKIDPHNWTKAAADNPILVGAGANNIRGGSVILDNGTYHVLYDTLGKFAYASGPALNNLTKHDANDAAVFQGQGSGWERFVRHPALIKVGSVYHMFYDGRSDTVKGSNGDIGHATSADMITWFRDGDNPVLTRGVPSWEAGDVGAPGMALIGGVYHLFYTGYDNSGAPFPHWIGYATSADIDGPWVKAFTNPILGPGGIGEWDEDLVAAPVVLESGGEVHLYFYGTMDSNDITAIGYATRDDL